MSILIKGIDLPKNIPQTIVLDTDGKVYRKEGAEWIEYSAVQIPKGHGRLIDGDGLLQRIVALPSFTTNFEGVPFAVLKDVEVLPEVRHSKAILESEEDDERVHL